MSLEKLDEDAHFDEKLHGLHSFLTDHLDAWEIASRGSLSLPPGVGRGIQMRKRILNLSTSGSSSGGMGCTIAVKVVDQDGREDAYIVEMDNSLAPMMDQYCHTRGIGDSSRSTLRQAASVAVERGCNRTGNDREMFDNESETQEAFLSFDKPPEVTIF